MAKVPVAAPPAFGAVNATVPSATAPAPMVTGEVLVTAKGPVAISDICAGRFPLFTTWKDAVVVWAGGNEPNDPNSATVFHTSTAPFAASVTWTRCWSSFGMSVSMVRTSS